MKVTYEVEVKTSSVAVAERFVQWMQIEHGADLLSVPGCQQVRVQRIDTTHLRCSYDFASQSHLQSYYDEFADEMRQKATAEFVSGELQIERRELALLWECSEP